MTSTRPPSQPRWLRKARGVRCSAKAKGTGEQCTLMAVRGATVCHIHGAAKGTRARAAADRRVEEERIRMETEKAVTTYGLPRDVDPGVALLEEVQRTAGHVTWLGARVAQIPEAELHHEQHAALLASYRMERAHYVRVAADAVRCGLKVRQVEVLERLAAQVMEAMRELARDLGYDPDDPRVLSSTVRHLRAIEGEVVDRHEVRA